MDKMLRTVTLLLLVLCVNLNSIQCYVSNGGSGNLNPQKLRLVYSWKSLEFDYPNEAARQEAVDKGEFIPGAPVPIDVDVARGSPPKVFVTIPRFQDGVPVTLGYVTKKVSPEGNPIIAPFPNWESNRLGNCDHITSVWRVKVDECGRLWVLDSGNIKEKQICPPQILLFNPHTGQLLSRFKIPLSQLNCNSLLITPAVDVRDPQGQCADTFIYIADVTGFQLIIYDHKHKRSWNIGNNLFYPYPPYGTFTIAGQSFDLMDGLFGLALGPLQRNGDRTLYFHSLASVVEAHVPTSVIRNYETFKDDSEAMPRTFQAFSLTRPSQSAAQAMDKNGVLFYGLISEIALGCWNSRDYPEFGGHNLDIVVVNRETLQFASGLKISSPTNGRDEVWVMTNSFQKVMAGLNVNETNFRIQAGYIDEIVRGTKCQVSQSNYQGGGSGHIHSLYEESGHWHHHHGHYGYH